MIMNTDKLNLRRKNLNFYVATIQGKHMKRGIIIIGLHLLLFHSVFAQVAGSVDPSFNPFALNAGSGMSGWGKSVFQKDGKIVIGGDIESYNGVEVNSVLRIHPNGTLDTTFSAGSGIMDVKDLAIQEDGKIIIAGRFTFIAGIRRLGIARLNTDGKVDLTFDPELGFSFWERIDKIAIQNDGKILVSGSFRTFNGIARRNFVRLNPDGKLDQSFDPAAKVNGQILTFSLLDDGHIFLGGAFNTYDGIPRKNLVKIKPNGDLVASFDPVVMEGSSVIELLMARNNQVIYKNNENSMFKLTGSGEVESSFETPLGQIGNWGLSTILENGQILVPGRINEMQMLIRLNEDGRVDGSFFAESTRFADHIFVSPLSDGKILVNGNFNQTYNHGPQGIIRLEPDGALDLTFNPTAGANNNITHLKLQKNGKILIGGYFTRYNSQPVNRLARLNFDGSLDSSFNPVGFSDPTTIHGIAIQPDEKILIAGFKQINRVFPNGELDNTFSTGAGFAGYIHDLTVQDDGKILVVGNFEDYNGAEVVGIVRLNSDGSLDPQFQKLYPKFDNELDSKSFRKVLVQPDGKIWISGDFIELQGITRKFIARLNNDGSLDKSFDPGEGPKYYVSNTDPTIRSLVLQPDGKIIIGGVLTSYREIKSRIVRINPDGTADTTFKVGEKTIDDGFISDMVLQPDGKLLIVGNFKTYQGYPRKHIARLEPNAEISRSFDPGSGANQTITTIALQPDGDIVIAGDFTGYNNMSLIRIGRLINDISPNECIVVAKAIPAIEIALDENGKAKLTPEMVDAGSSTSCGLLKLDLSKCDFTCSDLGEHRVKLYAIDADGNRVSTSFKATIVDNLKPVIKIDQNPFVWVMGVGDFFVMPDFTQTIATHDNCSYTITQKPAPGTVFTNPESCKIKFEVKDHSGNVAKAELDFELLLVTYEDEPKTQIGQDPSDCKELVVPWGSSFASVIEDKVKILFSGKPQTKESIIWSIEGYDPLKSGNYKLIGRIENNGFNTLDVSLEIPLRIAKKPFPLEIILTRNFISKTPNIGEVVGYLETIDPIDSIHFYSVVDNAFFYIEKNQVKWQGKGMPQLKNSMTISSTDRDGNTIQNEVFIYRKLDAPVDAIVYPNPASTETNIHVRLMESGPVLLIVFDTTGRELLREETFQKGSFTKSFDLQQYKRGIYHILIQMDTIVIQKKLIVY
jgi:uncharacterized delta-60 repeat protein